MKKSEIDALVSIISGVELHAKNVIYSSPNDATVEAEIVKDLAIAYHEISQGARMNEYFIGGNTND